VPAGPVASRRRDFLVKGGNGGLGGDWYASYPFERGGR